MILSFRLFSLVLRMVSVINASRFARSSVFLTCFFFVVRLQRGRTSAFIDGLVESCNDFFKRREQLLRRCTARTRSAAQHPGSPSRSWTAYVTFLAELLAAVSRMESSDKISGRIFCLAALLCECCHIMLRSPAQDTTAEVSFIAVTTSLPLCSDAEASNTA